VSYVASRDRDGRADYDLKICFSDGNARLGSLFASPFNRNGLRGFSLGSYPKE